MSEADGKGSFFLDTDSFMLGPFDKIAPRHSTLRVDEVGWGSFPTRLSMVHYLLRSSMTLSLDCREDTWAQFQDFSKGCAIQATQLVGNWKKVPNPAWVGVFRQQLKNSGKVDSSAIDNIGFSFTLTPKIHAYCFPSERRIEASAVALTHFRTINLILWTLAAELRGLLGLAGVGQSPTGDGDSIRKVVDEKAWSAAGENFVDFLLPYLFSLYFSNVDYSSLPIPRAPSLEMFMRAKTGSFAQMEFMLTHECAHLLLHEHRTASPELEREADTFSYELLLDNEHFWKNDSGLFYTSCRWLFLYLSIDRVIGAVLSGYDINWVDLPIRDRETWLIKRFAGIRFDSNEERDCQFLGDLILFQAKAKLYERGVDWIRSAAGQFEEQHCFPS